MSTVDPWTKGSPYSKRALWSTYAILNYAGSILCLLILWSFVNGRRKINAHDVFVGCLCLGCILMAWPCAIPCTLNLASGTLTFQYGDLACWFEAYFHVEAIEMQFLGVALIAGHSYFKVVWKWGTQLGIGAAVSVVFAVWILCASSTYLVGRASTYTLMPAGEYCFYAFDSPVIVYQFTPTMLLVLIAIVFFYARIFRYVAKSEHQVSPMLQQNRTPLSFGRKTTEAKRPSFSGAPPSPNSPPPSPNNPHYVRRFPRVAQPKALAFARSTAVFVLVFFLGWGPAVVACLYTVTTGHLTQELDILLAVCGSLHTLAVPIVYGFHSRRFRKWLFRMGCCAQRWANQYRRQPVANRITVVTKTIRIGTGEKKEEEVLRVVVSPATACR